MILGALFLVIFSGTIHAAVPSFGACPENRGLTSFDIGRYTGTWYEYANVFEVFQIGGKCVRATYTDNGDGTVGVFNEQIKKFTGNYGSINGTARLADPGYAEFVVNFDKVPFTTSTPNYRVLDTDYTSYSIVYNCNTILGFFKTEKTLRRYISLSAICCCQGQVWDYVCIYYSLQSLSGI